MREPRVFPPAPGAYPTDDGLTIRDWFATFAPRPSKDRINLHMKMDRNRNPHNDSHKPPIRSETEIIAELRYEFADAMMKARQVEQ
jgi:hypothetical protein